MNLKRAKAAEKAASNGAENGAANGGGTMAGQAAPPDDGTRLRQDDGRDREPLSMGASMGASTGASGGMSGGTGALPAADATFFAWLSEPRFPSREAAEAEAARELQMAANPSMSLLVSTVPGSGSPDDAYRKIESSLGSMVPDPDGEVPRHPLWSDDTVVFYHLRRHFGGNAATESMQRRRPRWYPIKPFGELQ